MNREVALDIVLKEIRKIKQNVDLLSGEDAPLYSGNFLDSIDLVTIVIGVEVELGKYLGTPVSLTTDKAFSYKNNPFTTIKSFVDFIMESVD